MTPQKQQNDNKGRQKYNDDNVTIIFTLTLSKFPFIFSFFWKQKLIECIQNHLFFIVCTNIFHTKADKNSSELYLLQKSLDNPLKNNCTIEPTSKKALNFRRLNYYQIEINDIIIKFRQLVSMDTFGQANYTNFNTDNPQQQPTKTVDLYGKARANFIQKVYSILSIQIFLTVVMSAFSMSSAAFFNFQLSNIWLFYFSLVVCLVIEIYMFCCNGGRTFPGNYICLGIFTFAESYIVSFICSATGKESGNHVVLMAAIYTLAIVVACTIYASYTQTDFTTSYGIVIVLGVALFILFIMTLFTSSPFIQNLYCCVGVMLFGVYLIIDTQMILGGKSIELTIDEYGLAAMLLYIDIIQIFLYILRLLSDKD